MKVVTVLGGNGYVGKRIIKKLLQNVENVKVYAVCRSGKIDDEQINSDTKVEIVKADAVNPKPFEAILFKSDAIIHCIGTLLASTEEYHKLNKDTLLNVLDTIKNNNNESKVNVVYVSAQRGLPFPLSLKYHGYIESKREAEEKLVTNYPNVNPVILRPGIIKDNKDRLWALPLYYESNLVNFVEKKFLNKILPNIGNTLNLPAKGTELEDLAKFAVAGALGNLNEKIYSDEDLANKTKVASLNLL